MPRVTCCVAGCALALVLSSPASAEDLPLRKPGLWEMKVARSAAGLPEVTMQHCTDATTDTDMNTTVSPIAKQICSRQDVQKTGTGYVVNSVCNIGGGTMRSHSEIVGDFDSAYAVTTASHSDKGPANLHDVTTRIEARWLGECEPDQKPGDVIMPGGVKLNVKDAQKLKALLPK
jgi:hypothetical protein